MDSSELVTKLENDLEFIHNFLEAHPKILENYVVENLEEENVDKWKAAIKKRNADEDAAKIGFAAVDYLKQENEKRNNTSQYKHAQLVIRRSANFNLSLRFKGRQYDSTRDKVTLTFGLGNKPSEDKDTLISCVVSDKPSGASNSWHCHVVSRDDLFKTVVVQVNVPSNAVVAKYKFSVKVQSGDASKTYNKNDILVIFNPFSPADDVYIESKDERDEYVMKDEGGLVYGSYTRNGADKRRMQPWYFGQFDSDILDIAFALLSDKSDYRVKKFPVKTLLKRKFPAHCCRLLSAMINSNDDNGVLVGKWTDDYEDGKRPTSWRGSVKILKQWYSQKQGVKYGQCWVFSGVLTTVMRALGIPSRSVTNFQSGHDSRMDAVIDDYICVDPTVTINHESDSVWNFHVWNEAFFKRPNLPREYSGWQAVDATPQERSGPGAVFQCGPAPVYAVKNGDMAMPHDTSFVFGEVNADKITWLVDEDDKIVGIFKRSSNAVGTSVCTKAVGKDELQDITDTYKYPEGSEEERAIFKKAFSLGEGYEDERPPVIPDNDLAVEVSVDGDPEFGNDVDFAFKIRNKSKVDKNVIVRCTIGVRSHTGKTLIKSLTAFKKEMSLKRLTEMTYKRNMFYQDYMYTLKGSESLVIQVNVLDINNKEFAYNTAQFEMKMPDMIKVKKALVEMGPSQYEVEVENKLKQPMTDPIVMIEGKGVETTEHNIRGVLAPGEKKTFQVKVDAPFTRYLNHSITLQCKEVENVSHYERIKVNIG